YVSRAARWARSIQHTSIIAILAVGSLSGCNPVTLDDAERHPTDAFDRIRSIDLLPRSPAAQEPNANGPDARQDAIYADSNVTTHLLLRALARQTNLSAAAVALMAMSSISRIRRSPQLRRSFSATSLASDTRSIRVFKARSR